MSAIAYVCVVSDFTLPTLQACLDIRPAHTVLIASDIFMPQALRLQTLLREKLTEGQTYVFSKDSTGHSLDGDDVCANANGWSSICVLGCVIGKPKIYKWWSTSPEAPRQ